MPQEPHRDERKSAAPWLSPGLVQSSEIILRTVLDPDHLENGKLAVAAISLEDIRFRGWSVDRKGFTSLRRVKSFHADWQKRRPDSQFYVLSIPVGVIRLPDPATGQQDFVVTDAATWLNPAHATVLLSGKQSPGAARAFRSVLLQRLPTYVDATQAFDSKDKYGYLRGLLMQFTAILALSFRHIFRPESQS